MKGDQRRWPLKTVELFFILSGAFFINVTLERTDILIFLVHGSYRSTRSQWEFCGSNTLHNYFLNLFDLLVTSRLFKRSIPQWCVCPFFFVILSIYSYVHEVLWLDVYTFEIVYFWPTGPIDLFSLQWCLIQCITGFAVGVFFWEWNWPLHCGMSRIIVMCLCQLLWHPK